MEIFSSQVNFYVVLSQSTKLPSLDVIFALVSDRFVLRPRWHLKWFSAFVWSKPGTQGILQSLLPPSCRVVQCHYPTTNIKDVSLTRIVSMPLQLGKYSASMVFVHVFPTWTYHKSHGNTQFPRKINKMVIVHYNASLCTLHSGISEKCWPSISPSHRRERDFSTSRIYSRSHNFCFCTLTSATNSTWTTTELWRLQSAKEFL